MDLSDVVGLTTPAITATMDRGRLRLFAKATGQTDPVYTVVDAARAAGHPDLLVPPTFLFGVELEQPEPFRWINELGIDMKQVLHGTQSFEYLAPVHAGDTVTSAGEVTDVQVKKGGALTFIERRSTVTREGVPVARLVNTTIVRSAA